MQTLPDLAGHAGVHLATPMTIPFSSILEGMLAFFWTVQEVRRAVAALARQQARATTAAAMVARGTLPRLPNGQMTRGAQLAWRFEQM